MGLYFASHIARIIHCVSILLTLVSMKQESVLDLLTWILYMYELRATIVYHMDCKFSDTEVCNISLNFFIVTLC